MEYRRLDGYASDLIRIKAKELIRTTEVPESEQEDIEQQLKLDLIERLRHYDPQRGALATFYRIVVDRRIASILARRAAPTKKPRTPMVSLHRIVDGEDGEKVELGETIEVDSGKRTDLADLRLDMARLRKSLPPRLRRLYDMLLQNTVTEIAQAFGVDRRTITRWKAELLERFRTAGLNDYL